MTWILGSLDPLIILNLTPYKTTKAMWDYLWKFYNQDHSARHFQLEHEIAMYSQGGLFVQDYFSGFKTYGMNLTILFMLKYVLNLSPSFKEFMNKASEIKFWWNYDLTLKVLSLTWWVVIHLPHWMSVLGITLWRAASLYTKCFSSRKCCHWCIYNSRERKGHGYGYNLML